MQGWLNNKLNECLDEIKQGFIIDDDDDDDDDTMCNKFFFGCCLKWKAFAIQYITAVVLQLSRCGYLQVKMTMQPGSVLWLLDCLCGGWMAIVQHRHHGPPRPSEKAGAHWLPGRRPGKPLKHGKQVK